MSIKIDISDGRIKNLLHKDINIFKSENMTHFSYSKTVNFSRDIIGFCKGNNGITIVEEDEFITIYNDPFRTIPLFYTTDRKGNIYIFTNFEDFFSNFEDNEIDKVGLWETILLGQAINTRTLFKNVKQMTSASAIVISRNHKNVRVERYWDYNINENSSINNIESAAKGLYERLDVIFNNIDKNDKYTLGLSGGLDSRITLGYLKKHFGDKKIDLFTYGYHEKILDYKYAKEVAHKFGYNKPKFHILNGNSYTKALEYLPQKSGGQIGINHCHIIDYLINNFQYSSENKKMISTYYSDAVFGFETKLEKGNDSIEDLFAYKEVTSNHNVPEDIKEIIIDDIKNVINKFDHSSNFSSINEYWYVTERNPKFHMNLAYLQSEFIPIITPYANYDLLNYMISLPLQYRYEKRLVDFILENYFGFDDKNKKNVSSRLWKPGGWKKDISTNSSFYQFKTLNYINALLMSTTNGNLYVLNKYQTENQNAILRKYLKGQLITTLDQLKEMNMIDGNQLLGLSNIPLRANKLGVCFNIIGIGKLLNTKK